MILDNERLIWSEARRIGTDLGHLTGNSLSRFIHPQHLQYVALSIYAPDQADPVLASAKSTIDVGREAYRRIAHAYTKGYSTELPDEGQLIRGYGQLVARNRHVRRGILVESMTGELRAGRIVGAQAEKLEVDLARFVADCESVYPYLNSLAPGARLVTSPIPRLEMVGGNRFDLPRTPRVVVEYGPGINGFYTISKQPRVEGTWSMVDSNKFIALALTQYAMLKDNYRFPFVPVYETMSQHSAATIGLGIYEVADLVIMSMVHSAGSSELQTSINNSYQLLCKGGHLALSLPTTNRGPKDADAMEVLRHTEKTFSSKPAFYADIKLMQATTQRISDGYAAVFTK